MGQNTVSSRLCLNRNTCKKGKGRKSPRFMRLPHQGMLLLYLALQKSVYPCKIPFVKILGSEVWSFPLQSDRLIFKLNTLEMGTISVEVEKLEVDSPTTVCACIPLGNVHMETHTSVRETLYITHNWSYLLTPGSSQNPELCQVCWMSSICLFTPPMPCSLGEEF